MPEKKSPFAELIEKIMENRNRIYYHTAELQKNLKELEKLDSAEKTLGQFLDEKQGEI